MTALTRISGVRGVWLFALLLSSATVQASLITNGSFEDFGGQNLNRNGWGFFQSIPGWVGGDHLEVQASGLFVPAQDGDFYAELQAHPDQTAPFQLFSDGFLTELGTRYELSFFARKRSSNDGAFQVSIAGVEQTISNHLRGEWTEYTLGFDGTGGEARVAFLSLQSGTDKVGHFLDNVSVVVAVPEPETVALVAVGIAGLMLRRRRLVRA